MISAPADPAAWSDLGGLITPEEVSPVTANAQSFPMALVLVMGLIAAAAAGGIVLLMKSRRQH